MILDETSEIEYLDTVRRLLHCQTVFYYMSDLALAVGLPFSWYSQSVYLLPLPADKKKYGALARASRESPVSRI